MGNHSEQKLTDIKEKETGIIDRENSILKSHMAKNL